MYGKGIIAFIPFFTVLLSCSRQEPDSGTQIISLHLGEPEVKTIYNNDRTHLVWENGDKVRIFNDADGAFADLEYVKDSRMEIMVPAKATAVKAVYPACEGSFVEPSFVFKTEQSQREAGVFPGAYYPLCATARIQAGEALLSFAPVGSAFAMNVHNPSVSGEKLESISIQAAQMDKAVITRLKTPWLVATSKPESKRLFEGQVYSCFEKGIYNKVRFVITTDRTTYSITSNDTFIDCSSYDVQVLNLNLANCTVSLCIRSDNEQFEIEDITCEDAGLQNPTVVPTDIQLTDDTIPDFSRVGYMWGEKDFPTSTGEFINVVEFPAASGGDDTAAVQAAIDNAAYGTIIRFKPQEYIISGILSLNRSGIVLQGAVDSQGLPATTFRAAGNTENDIRDLLVVGTAVVSGSDYYTTTDCALSADEDHDDAYTVAKRTVRSSYPSVSTGSAIIGSAYCGSMFVSVMDPQMFSPGSSVQIYRPATNTWLDAIHMREIVQNPGDKGHINQWSTSDYGISWERTVTAVKGNRIYFDNPLVMRLDDTYGRGMLQLISWDRVTQCGIENIRFVSDHDGSKLDSDNNHAFNAITIKAAEHCWINNVDSWYFAQSCVDMAYGAKNITVRGCRQHQPCGQVKGGLRYAFHVSRGALCLIDGCTADRDRHGFVTGARVAGPNVFIRCTGTNMKNVTGPHQRWATGLLYDHVTTDQNIVVQDGGNFGTGHGWQGANVVLWVCSAPAIICQSPWASAYNYAIGCTPSTNSPGRGYPYADVLGPRPDAVWRPRTADEPEYLYEETLASRLASGEMISDIFHFQRP